MRLLAHCQGENDIKVMLFDPSPVQPFLRRRWSGLLPIGEAEEPDIHVGPLTKSREQSSIILTLIHTFHLSPPLTPFPLLSLASSSSQILLLPLLPFCLWLEKNFSIAAAHFGFEVGGLNFPLLHNKLSAISRRLGGTGWNLQEEKGQQLSSP